MFFIEVFSLLELVKAGNLHSYNKLALNCFEVITKPHYFSTEAHRFEEFLLLLNVV